MSARVLLTLDDVPLANTVYHGEAEAIVILSRTLDALQKHSIRCILYTIGSRLTPSLIELMRSGLSSNRRLEIGNHTFGHLDFARCDVGEYLADIDRNTELLQSTFQRVSTYFRPPFLSLGSGARHDALRSALRARHLELQMPDISVGDWDVDWRHLNLLEASERAAAELRSLYLEGVVAAVDRRVANTDTGAELVLLLHANSLNSLLLDRLLRRRCGVFL